MKSDKKTEARAFNKAICILFVYSIAVPLYAYKTYTLQELAQIALKRSNLIHAKNNHLEAMDGAISQTKVWQNPSITTIIGTKTEDTSSGHKYSLHFSQPFYFPGKQDLKTKIQETFKKDASLSLEKIKRYVFQRVIYLGFAYNEAVEHSQHLNERRHRFKIVQKYLRSRPFASPQKRLEKILVENKILLLEKEILSVRNKKETVWEELNLHLGLDAPIRIQAKWFIKGILLRIEDLKQELKKNFIWRAQKNLLNRKDLQKSLAQKDKYPDFSISAIYENEKVNQSEKYLGGGITFHLPLWDRSEGKVFRYKKELSAIRAKISFLERKLLTELKVAHVEYENKRSLIKKYPITSLKTIHKQMRFVDREFRKGRIELLSYLEFENSSSDIHTAVFEAQVEYLRSYLQILLLTGSMDFQEEK